MPETFSLLATPFWVNLLIFVPFVAWYFWKNHKLNISNEQLTLTAIFGASFAVVESACVVYLRAATGLLPGFLGTLADVQRRSIEPYSQLVLSQKLPASLLTVEMFREAATMVMLLMIAFIVAKKMNDRAAIFLWTFAVWDIFYYVHLFLLVRWPSALTTPDILFLIPEPWISQVWFPFLVSGLSLLAVFLNRTKNK